MDVFYSVLVLCFWGLLFFFFFTERADEKKHGLTFIKQASKNLPPD